MQREGDLVLLRLNRMVKPMSELYKKFQNLPPYGKVPNYDNAANRELIEVKPEHMFRAGEPGFEDPSNSFAPYFFSEPHSPTSFYFFNMTLLTEYFLGLAIIYFLLVLALLTSKTFGVNSLEPLSKSSFCVCVFCFVLLCTDPLTENPQFIQKVELWRQEALWDPTTVVIHDATDIKRTVSFLGSIENDSLSLFVRLALASFASLFFLVISDTFQEQRIASFEFIILLLFSLLGMFVLCSANDFLVAYLALELISLSSYILTAFKKSSSYSIEAGIKYFVVGTVSSALFLLGSSFIYFFTGAIEFYTANELVCAPVLLDILWEKAKDTTGAYGAWGKRLVWHEAGVLAAPIMFQIFFLKSGLSNPQNLTEYTFMAPISAHFIEFGLTLLFIGLFIKLGVAPFHFWTLDVYEGAPTNSTVFFTIFPKVSLMALLTRLYYINFQHFGAYFQPFFIWVALLSLFFGTFGGLRQRKLKTLVSYSSLTNIGYSLLAFSSQNPLGLGGSFFNMGIYMFTSLAFWSAILTLRVKPLFHEYATKYSKELGDLALLRLSNPSAAFSLALIMFSTAGVPPLIGFLSKSIIFLSIIEQLSYFIGVICILFSVISSFYYIRIIKIMYFENLIVGRLYFPGFGAKLFVLSIFSSLLFLLFVNPTYLLSQANNFSLYVFDWDNAYFATKTDLNRDFILEYQCIFVSGEGDADCVEDGSATFAIYDRTGELGAKGNDFAFDVYFHVHNDR